MRRSALFALALTLAAPLVAAPKAAPKPAAEPKLMQSCDAHKFEAVVDTVVDNQPRKSKVKLCGVEGQSDADWIGTLRDAIRKLDANKDMAPATRDQIVAAINAEIGRLSIVGPPISTKRQAQEQSAPPLSRDYAALPPLPTQPEPSVTANAAEVAVAKDFAALPPLPAPTPAVPAAALIAARPLRLTIECEAQGDIAGSGPCAGFERETIVTIRPAEDIPAGTSLQFVRNGEAKGDIALDGLIKGRTLRSGLPRDVCSGFGAGRLELRIVRAADARVLQSEGPYALRC